MKVKFITVARAELRAAKRFHNQVRRGLGGQLEAQVYRAIERIVENPHAWLELSPNTRRITTHQFPYNVI